MSYPCIMGGGECEGCGRCRGEEEEKEYYCPICGEKIFESVYVSTDGEIVGCESCVSLKDAWEVMA